ncbi:hypothetical protein ABPG75_007081 [Micractinium tetrahymenae]
MAPEAAARSQSAQATCVIVLTEEPPKNCCFGSFLVGPLSGSRACYDCKTGLKAAPGSIGANSPGMPNRCPGCAPRAYCASCFGCSDGSLRVAARVCQCVAGTFLDTRPTSKSAGVCVPCSAIKPGCKQCQTCGPLYQSKCNNGGLCQPP